MFNCIQSKTISITLIFSIVLLYSPHLLTAQSTGSGNLIGFVFDKDGTTPVEGAIVKLRNISTSRVYESSKTDNLGIFKVEGIDEGLYVMGVSSKDGDFNVENIIGIRADETAKISLALKPQAEGATRNYAAPILAALAAFFTSAAGIAVIIAATAALVYGIVKLTEEEPEASPIKR
jgi:hypothetical protein